MKVYNALGNYKKQSQSTVLGVQLWGEWVARQKGMTNSFSGKLGFETSLLRTLCSVLFICLFGDWENV